MKAALILAVAGLLLAPVTSVGQAAEPEQAPSITVTGEGRVSAEPDMATINVGVVSEAEGAEAALEANSEAMRQLFESLAELGVAEKDMQTTSFDVSPQRRHEEGKEPQIVGYQVRNQVQVKVRKLDRLGRLLDEAVGQGANEIGGISFSVSDPSKLLDDARREALKDARRKAELYAETADVELGRLEHLSEQGGVAPPPRPMAFARQAESVPIASGEEELRVHVTARYGIRYAGGGH